MDRHELAEAIEYAVAALLVAGALVYGVVSALAGLILYVFS